MLNNKTTIQCSVAMLKHYSNPFKKNMWPYSNGWVKADNNIIKNMLNKILPDNRKNGQEWRNLNHDDALNYHNSRIAYMIQNKDDKPLDIDVSDIAGIILEDGNHRLASAIYSQDNQINIKINEDQLPILEKLSYIHDNQKQVSFAIAISENIPGRVVVKDLEDGQQRICFLSDTGKFLTPLGEFSPEELSKNWFNLHEPLTFTQACKNPEKFKTYEMKDFINMYALKDMIDPIEIKEVKNFIENNDMNNNVINSISNTLNLNTVTPPKEKTNMFKKFFSLGG